MAPMSCSGDTPSVLGAMIFARHLKLGQPSVGEVAGLLVVVVGEALVVELLLEVGHLRAGEQRRDGELLGVDVVGDRARVEVEDGHQRQRQDGERDDRLEQREARGARAS